MTPNHVAKLITTAQREKPVQYFGPDPIMLARVARTWLEAQGQPGDEFQIYEIREVRVRTVKVSAVTSKGLVLVEAGSAGETI